MNYTAGRNENGATTLENGLAGPQKLNIKLPHNPAISPLGIYPRKVKIYEHTKTSA